MMSNRHPLAERLTEQIHRFGPITFADFQEAALYDDEGGFFTTGGGAGRAGRDFVTSPEVGSLFGLLVARHLDRVWTRLGTPDPFVVVEVGAGRGRLASDVLRATPACAPALRYVLVERSAALREEQAALLALEPADEALGPFVRSRDPDDADVPVPGTGPLVTSIPQLPGVTFEGVVLANELLDNLPVRIVERRDSGWDEVRVGTDAERGGGTFVEVLVPADAALAAEADTVLAGAPAAPGTRIPVPVALVDWLATVATVLRRGQVLLVDYADTGAGLAARGPAGWLRTYRFQERGGAALEAPGSQDITTDVALEHLRTVATRCGFTIGPEATQADWLADLGMAGLVEEGRAVWEARAHLGDLAAVAGRSRVGEAAALADPGGLGAHRVITLERDLR